MIYNPRMVSTAGGVSTVLISLNCLNGYERQVMAGICSFALSRRDWELVSLNPDPVSSVRLPKGQFSGVIGRVTGRLAEDIVCAGLPAVVTSSGGNEFPELPRVVPDNVAVGTLAAEHLLTRRYRTFAYAGGTWRFAVERLTGFRDRLAEAGHPVVLSPGDGADTAVWHGLRQPAHVDLGFADWVLSLPRPAAILADRDETGVRVLKICRDAGVVVPDEIAVVGVDNDEVLCQICQPPMSSIAIPAEQIGADAAALLARLSGDSDWVDDHGPSATGWTRVAPTRLVIRRSSRVVHAEPAELAAAMKFIRSRVDQPIQVVDVVSAGSTCRRTLERQFRQHFGHTIRDAIEQAHLDQAKSLLSSGDLPLKTIASRSGFSSVERFHIVFRRAVGLTPLAFRAATVSADDISTLPKISSAR